MRGAGLVALLAALIVLALPRCVAHYLKANASGLLARYVSGEIHLEHVSLGWFRPLEIRGVKLVGVPKTESNHHADEDRLLGTIESLETEVSLWALLWSPTDFGTVRMQAPRARLVCGPGESNWEQFLKPLMELPVSDRPLAVRWELHDAEILIKNTNEASSIRCRLPVVRGSWRRGSPSSLDLHAGGEIDHQQADRQRAGGHVSLTVRTDAAAGSRWDDAVPRCVVQWNDVPLELLAALATRWNWNIAATGRTSGKCEGYLTPNADWRWTDVTLTAATFDERQLLREPLRCERIALRGGLVFSEHTWNLDTWAESDFGTVQIAVKQMPRQGADLTTLWRAATRLSLQADVDVAKLATRLPQTLRLVDGLELDSAGLVVRAALDRKGTTSLVSVEIQASNWQARYRDQVVAWPQPLSATISLQALESEWKVEQLACHSEFLTATWRKGARDSEVAIVGDLGRLDERLHQFFRWPIRLAGHINGTIAWQHQTPHTHIGAQLGITNWSISYNGQQLWSEPKVRVDTLATFRSSSESQALQLVAAELLWTLGGDRCKATLVDPVVLGAAGPMTWRVDVAGELGDWHRRLSLWTSQNSIWQVGGRMEAVAEVKTTTDSAALDNVKVLLTEPRVTAGKWAISQPQLELSLARLSLDSGSHARAVHVKDLQFRGLAVNVYAPDLAWQWPGGSQATTSEKWLCKGTVDFQVDLARLQQSISVPGQGEAGFFAEANIKGHLALDTVSTLHADLEGLKITRTQWLYHASSSPGERQPPPMLQTVIWHDPQAQLDAAFRWQQGQEIQLDRLTLIGGGWSSQSHGTVQNLSTAPTLWLEGTLTYDWEKLRGRSALLATKRVVIAGQRSTGFAVNGPLQRSSQETSLLPSALQGRLSIGWQGAEVFGVVVGPGEADLALQEAVVTIRVPELPVSGGTVRVTPSVDLRGKRPVLLVAAGPLLDGVELTPAMCRSWLQYIHPLVAGATRAQGRLGLYLDSCRVPLDAVHEAELAGTLRIAAGSVGAGPLMQEVIGVMERVAALVERRLPRLSALAREDWIEMPPQQVAFQVSRQQVAHQGLKMFVRDVPVATQGIVGFDQSLRLDLDLTIPDRWTENRPLLARLRGRTFRVPIRGTLTRPELDERFFAELARQLLSGQAGQMLEEGLLRGLDRLLKDR